MSMWCGAAREGLLKFHIRQMTLIWYLLIYPEPFSAYNQLVLCVCACACVCVHILVTKCRWLTTIQQSHLLYLSLHRSLLLIKFLRLLWPKGWLHKIFTSTRFIYSLDGVRVKQGKASIICERTFWRLFYIRQLLNQSTIITWWQPICNTQ